MSERTTIPRETRAIIKELRQQLEEQHKRIEELEALLWDAGERLVDSQLAQGLGKTFNNAEDAIKWLKEGKGDS